MDLVGLLGVGSSLVGGILGNREQAKRRKEAMRWARRLLSMQNRDFAAAFQQIKGAQGQYENDPRRATLKAEWDKRMAQPDLITPEMLSLMKNQSYDQAARESGDSGSSLREMLQRQGMSGSGYGAGLQAAQQSRSFGRHAGISTRMDMEAAQKNRAARDDTLAGYQDFAMSDLARQLGFSESLASLYGSKQYGNSMMGGF
jgi:hypothetical protein